MQNLWQAAYNEVGNHHPVFSCHIFHICKAMYCTKDPNRRHKIIKYKQDHPTLWPLLKATVNYQLGKMQIGVTSIELKLGSSGFQSLHECQEWIYCHSTSDAAKNVHQLIPFIVLLSTKKGFNSKCWWVPSSLDSTPVWTFSTLYLFHLPSIAPKRVIKSIFVHLLPQNLQSARFWYSLNSKPKSLNPNFNSSKKWTCFCFFFCKKWSI